MSASDTALSDMVAQCLALIEDGVETIPYGEICAAHPDLEPVVKESVRMATQLPEMHLAGPGVDGRIRSVIADRYMVRERVGSGAMGVVYAATDLDLGREVAVKVMQTGIVQHATALARFEREASALAAVQHESIVTIYDRGITEDGMSFLVMELVEGVPCSEILELARGRGSVDDDSSSWLTEKCGIDGLTESSFLRQVMRWTAEVAGGLAAAHAAGVVHRDVKPSNIIIRPDGRAVLLDFGIAAKEDQEKLTQTGATIGTPAYMAPEALMGEPEAQPSQDVYGLAATLYHFLTLEAPYRGGAHEVLSAIATREPIPAVKVRPGLPRDAQAILDHGLARDPASRYASLGAMESDIRALLDYRPVSVRPTGTATRAWRRVKRSRMALGAACASLLIALVLAGVQWRSTALAARNTEFQSIWPQVPANYSIVKAPNRYIADEAKRADVGQVLDSLVATKVHVETARNLRAAFRLDHGDREGAIADIKSLAQYEGGAFLGELLKRYEALPKYATGTAQLDLNDLPDPVGPTETYTAALHYLRVKGGTKLAMPLIGSDVLDGNRHIEELRLLLKAAPLNNLRKQHRHGEVAAKADALNEEAAHFLTSSGFDGAMALQAVASARLNQGRYEDSIRFSERLLRMAPASHVAWQNLAEARYHLGQYQEGLAAIAQALKLTPEYATLDQIKAKLEMGAKDFDAARQTVKDAAYPSTASGDSMRNQLAAIVEATAALEIRDEDPDMAQALAARASEFAAKIGRETSRQLTEQRIRAIAHPDTDEYFRLMLGELMEWPNSVPTLRAVMRHWPEAVGTAEIDQVKSWIDWQVENRIGSTIAPDLIR